MRNMYIDKIPAEAKQIANSYDYIDPHGNVYGIERRNNRHKGQPFIKTQSTIFGYKYCGINYRNGQHITKRVHKLVAEAFIPNPTHLPIVLHKDNNKKNNQVSNLKWGTIAENTQQAFDDGLCVNAKGFDDNQSIPCDCYDSLTNQLIDKYGSVSIATQNTGITKGGILYQLNNPNQPIRKAKYFVLAGQGPRRHDIIVQYNKNGDEINRFTTIGKASLVTGIPQSTISRQVFQIQMPNWTKEDCYFKKLTI
ncbi:MAG: HNH endonuclease [Butyrivibrio sp.]|nr:HNH endonuclease [Butyrivibrio sp.]